MAFPRDNVVDPESLPSDVMRDACRNMGIDPDENDENWKKASKLISSMTAYEVFDRYLRWNGMIGFTDSIIEAMDGIEDAACDQEEVPRT